jgi:hypothetical protein
MIDILFAILSPIKRFQRMLLITLVPIEMAIVKAQTVLVMGRLINAVLQVVNLPVVMKTVTTDAVFHVSNTLFLLGLSTTQLNNAGPILDLNVTDIEIEIEISFVHTTKVFPKTSNSVI